MWALFNSQPPRWHTGAGSDLLNAGVFAAGLLGQSYVSVLALLTFANRLPLWLHLPVQLASLGTLMVQHNTDMCASVLMSTEVGVARPSEAVEVGVQHNLPLCLPLRQFLS